MSTAPLPTQSSDFPAWYGEVVRRAGLAENSSVRGAMVIKPYGYAIWEAIQRELDDRIKATGHENFYLPLLMPASVLAQESSSKGSHPRSPSSPRRAGRSWRSRSWYVPPRRR
jgi:prolyl-tRNA synthetase